MALANSVLSPNQKAVLVDGLADLHPAEAKARVFTGQVGLANRLIRSSEDPIVLWDSIVRVAIEFTNEKKPLLLELVELATKDHPHSRYLVDVATGALSIARGPVLVNGPATQPGTTTWAGESAEKLMGPVSNLLPSSFLTLGAARAKAVVRVVRSDGELGTGFLLEGGLFITNHHVLPTLAHAQSSVIEFGYEAGRPRTPLALAPTKEAFATDMSHDWTAILIGEQLEWGSIPLPPAKVAIGARVSIIQHPNGEHKQVALQANKVAFVNEERLQYFTDTLPGSSGSPVFDLQWRWVGLHHSGGHLREPGTDTPVYRNEGITAQTVLAGIQAAGLLKKA